jgi:hypothetical protein
MDMVTEAAVDMNVLSYSVPIIMRGRGEVDRRDENQSLVIGRGEARPRGSGVAESIPKPSGEAELALIP